MNRRQRKKQRKKDIARIVEHLRPVEVEEEPELKARHNWKFEPYPGNIPKIDVMTHDEMTIQYHKMFDQALEAVRTRGAVVNYQSLKDVDYATLERRVAVHILKERPLLNGAIPLSAELSPLFNPTFKSLYNTVGVKDAQKAEKEKAQEGCSQDRRSADGD